MLLALMTISMLIEGFGFLAESAWVKICAVFASAFFSSWLYGMMITYLEGRKAAESMFAINIMCLIYAGNANHLGLDKGVFGGQRPSTRPPTCQYPRVSSTRVSSPTQQGEMTRAPGSARRLRCFCSLPTTGTLASGRTSLISPDGGWN